MSTHSPGFESELSVEKTLLNSFVRENFSNEKGDFITSEIDSMSFSNTTTLETLIVNVAGTMYVFLIPLLVTIGVIGNILSVFVFFTSKLRMQSTSQYLSALAVSDSVFLMQLVPPWFSTIELNGLFHQQGFCQVFVYVSYVTCCFSAWLVIAFTVERFVAVQYPLQCTALCTVKRARYIICALAVAASLVNIPVLLFAGPGDEECNIDREKIEYAARFNWADTVLSFTIPLALIVVLNSWIMIGVWRLDRERLRLVRQEQTARPTSRCGLRLTRPITCPSSQQRVTRMLLLVSSVFVVFNLPAYTMRILAYIYDMNSNEMNYTWMAVQHVSAILFNANFGINFFLYCLSGQNFRRELLQTVPCLAWFNRSTTELASRRRDNFEMTSMNPNIMEITGDAPTRPSGRWQRFFACLCFLRRRRNAPRRLANDDSRSRRHRSCESIEMKVISHRASSSCATSTLASTSQTRPRHRLLPGINVPVTVRRKMTRPIRQIERILTARERHKLDEQKYG